MKFNESSLPELYSQVLLAGGENKISMTVGAEDAYKIYEVMIASMSDFLKIVKNNAKTAIAINDIKGNLILAGIVTYHENEDDKDMPGNYSYQFTTDAEDIKDAVIYSIDDDRFIQITITTAHHLYGMVFEESRYINGLYVTAAETLLEWLDSNATEKEEVSIELPGYFVATVAVEEGEKVVSIIPDGAMKRLIKDDASIEK